METTKWILDPAHTSVEFEVRHLMISTVTGRFSEAQCDLEADENFENAKFSFSANVNSVSTFDEKRDAHLKSADFFDAEKHPKITFVSVSFKKTGENQFELTGDLTIRGTTKTINLAVTYGGTVKDPYGKIKAGFELTGHIKRSDFGLVWNATIEAGGVLVGDEVKIVVNVEFEKQSAA